MVASNWRTWVQWAVLVPCWVGCQTQGPPRDPLFISKTPMSAKAQYGPPVAIAYLEPTLPRDPFLAASTPSFADKNVGSVPGTLTNRPRDKD
ncbi:MAG TPA: hypothetical protein VNX28_04720 [Gemmataceae bacterium]|jgi:hypothetical protein|nr:hypothetical protein [Gemmataceae bacterium]